MTPIGSAGWSPGYGVRQIRTRLEARDELIRRYREALERAERDLEHLRGHVHDSDGKVLLMEALEDVRKVLGRRAA